VVAWQPLPGDKAGAVRSCKQRGPNGDNGRKDVQGRVPRRIAIPFASMVTGSKDNSTSDCRPERSSGRSATTYRVQAHGAPLENLDVREWDCRHSRCCGRETRRPIYPWVRKC